MKSFSPLHHCQEKNCRNQLSPPPSLFSLTLPQDAFQEEYYRTGVFPETPWVPPRRPWSLVNWLFWASLLLYPFFRFLVSMVSSGSSVKLASLVLIFCVGECRARGWKLSWRAWQGPDVWQEAFLVG